MSHAFPLCKQKIIELAILSNHLNAYEKIFISYLALNLEVGESFDEPKVYSLRQICTVTGISLSYLHRLKTRLLRDGFIEHSIIEFHGRSLPRSQFALTDKIATDSTQKKIVNKIQKQNLQIESGLECGRGL